MRLLTRRIVHALAVTCLLGPMTPLSAQVPIPAAPSGAHTAVLDTAQPTLITTFSGGISLGAYQAGVDWALLEFYRAANRSEPFRNEWGMRPVRFGTAAGASAGNVNAVLWAIEACTAMGRWQAPQQSLFWQMWMNIDVDDLLLENPSDTAELALLDRGFIERLQPRVARRMDAGKFSPKCEVPVGITLTRVLPHTISLDRIPVRTQRFVVPMVARVESAPADSGAGGGSRSGSPMRMVFRRPRSLSPERLGPLRLPVIEADSTIALDSVFQIIKASSAFPFTFQPVLLNTVDEGGKKMAGEMFVDGGVFDNNPVDLALVLHVTATKVPDSVSVDNPGVRLLYVDPDNPRADTGKSCFDGRQGMTGERCRARKEASTTVAPGGLRPVLRLLAGAVTSAREYELFALSRNRQASPEPSQVLTTREYHVTGERLAAFGAFLNRAYREHDFYVGAYDAIHYVLCEAPADSARAALAGRTSLCTYKNVMALADSLALTRPGRQLIALLAADEFRMPATMASPVGTPHERAVAQVYQAVARSLASKQVVDAQPPGDGAACSASLALWLLCRDGTNRFLAAFQADLANRGFTAACRRPGTAAADSVLRRVADEFRLCPMLGSDVDNYFQAYFDRLMRQLVVVERRVDAALAEANPDANVSAGMQSGMEAVRFIYQSTSLRPHVGWYQGGIPMNEPTAWRYAPAYLGWDAYWDGAEIGWEPMMYGARRPGSGWAVPLTLRWNNPTGGPQTPHWYAGAGVRVVKRTSDLWTSLGWTRTDAALMVFQPLDGTRPSVTADVGTTLLADRIRVGVRASVVGRPVDGGRRLHLVLGLNDINGLGYLLRQLSSR